MSSLVDSIRKKLKTFKAAFGMKFENFNMEEGNSSLSDDDVEKVKMPLTFRDKFLVHADSCFSVYFQAMTEKPRSSSSLDAFGTHDHLPSQKAESSMTPDRCWSIPHCSPLD